MLYTPLTKLATNVAFRAHEGQVGKDGLPYVTHPLHVAESMPDETSTCAALLHDVVEDTDITTDDLRALGIPEEVIRVIDVLTHRRGETYDDYVRRVARDPVARVVKLADLRHNMDETRLGMTPEEAASDAGTLRRRAKYARALDILS